MQVVRVLILFDGGLHLVERLFDEGAILDVQNAISIALNFRVMGHHHARRCAVLTFSLRSDSVDIENQVHDGDGGPRVQITGWLIKQKDIGLVGESASNGYSLLLTT